MMHSIFIPSVRWLSEAKCSMGTASIQQKESLSAVDRKLIEFSQFQIVGIIIQNTRMWGKCFVTVYLWFHMLQKDSWEDSHYTACRTHTVYVFKSKGGCAWGWKIKSSAQWHNSLTLHCNHCITKSNAASICDSVLQFHIQGLVC